MALMTSMRDKTHIILYTLLAAFLALIVFEWGMNFSGPASHNGQAGKVNGKAIPYSEYEALYRQYSESFRRSNPGAEITPEAELGIGEQAWNTLVDQALLEEQFRKFGVTVEDSEVLAAIRRPDPPRIIAQNFMDPETGQIDRARLDSARQDPRNSEMWVQVEDLIRRELKIDKLLRALRTMEHVTELETDELVRRQYTRMSASFIPVSFSYAGDDAGFAVSEAEIKKYYDDHREMFRQTPSRAADYVFFPLVPSASDSSAARSELESLRAEFASAVSDSAFVSVQSDMAGGADATFDRSDFSPEAASLVFGSPSMKAGGMIGPVADEGAYRLLKVKKVVSASRPVARAAHILLSFNPADKAAAAKARSTAAGIMAQLKGGASFADLARRYSEDPGSAPEGGELGWFSSGRMVPEFSDAVFGAAPGSIVGPVETRFGLHIIKVEGFDRRAFVGSSLSRSIRPSSETSESVRRRAMAFQMDAKEKGFAESAATEKVPVSKTGEFTRHMQIPGIGYSDKVGAFAFKAGEGDLSDVLETDRGFYVMRLSSKNDSGYRRIDDGLKAAITTELIKEKKGEFIRKKLQALVGAPGATLEKIAAADKEFSLLRADDIRWSDGFIPGYGVDRPLVEAMAGMPEGKLSLPVRATDGYAVFVVAAKTLPEGFDLKAEKATVAPRLLQLKQEQLFQEYFAAIRKSAKIEDLRP
ncbi:peptidylprolyl isomerase [Chlorobium sp. N1]|uniref:peptidylprolyl isomerase n=1 Tax=Chlorobium sp. N1 TaxID=2491138 RepID=UPI00103BB9C4|nr:peptidylprolyl isomerase [Chlorobium sp. N1]TCD47993.1 peptidylprolyl isomerase [Chlorobium sp. N1]